MAVHLSQTLPLLYLLQPLTGHAAVVTLLLLCGADPLTRARDGLTPLHKAAEFGRARAALALLEHPAVSPDCQSAFGTVPLIPACVKNHKGVVRVLLNARADPSLRAANSGLTPLQVACVHSAAAAAAELLAAGADPNDAGGRHPSPLHLAVHNISPECARVLIAAGADTGAVFRKPLLQVLEETPLRGMVPKERVDAVKNAVQNALEIRAEAIFWRRSPLLMMRELVLRGRAVLRGSVQPARVGRAPCASGAAEKAPLGSKEGSGSDYGGVNAPSATCEYAAGSGAEESCDGAQRSAFDDSSGHPAKAVQHGSVMDSAQEIGSSCNAHVDAAGGVVLGPLLRMVMDLPDNPFAAVVLFL
ncbi:ankyrin repeat-containing domain protein [Tribonema minus]|uniref:Ankyrin repeat-containing domain protein n=1 Tax=Tribonema minus TaxID=303371 RepID=A0A835YJS6_9STRA|nr:ankyrin repeat-containing domain protein [Tribonema minus]